MITPPPTPISAYDALLLDLDVHSIERPSTASATLSRAKRRLTNALSHDRQQALSSPSPTQTTSSHLDPDEARFGPSYHNALSTSASSVDNVVLCGFGIHKNRDNNTSVVAVQQQQQKGPSHDALPEWFRKDAVRWGWYGPGPENSPSSAGPAITSLSTAAERITSLHLQSLEDHREALRTRLANNPKLDTEPYTRTTWFTLLYRKRSRKNAFHVLQENCRHRTILSAVAHLPEKEHEIVDEKGNEENNEEEGGTAVKAEGEGVAAMTAVEYRELCFFLPPACSTTREAQTGIISFVPADYSQPTRSDRIKSLCELADDADQGFGCGNSVSSKKLRADPRGAALLQRWRKVFSVSTGLDAFLDAERKSKIEEERKEKEKERLRKLLARRPSKHPSDDVGKQQLGEESVTLTINAPENNDDGGSSEHQQQHIIHPHQRAQVVVGVFVHVFTLLYSLVMLPACTTSAEYPRAAALLDWAEESRLLASAPSDNGKEEDTIDDEVASRYTLAHWEESLIRFICAWCQQGTVDEAVALGEQLVYLIERIRHHHHPISELVTAAQIPVTRTSTTSNTPEVGSPVLLRLSRSHISTPITSVPSLVHSFEELERPQTVVSTVSAQGKPSLWGNNSTSSFFNTTNRFGSTNKSKFSRTTVGSPPPRTASVVKASMSGPRSGIYKVDLLQRSRDPIPALCAERQKVGIVQRQQKYDLFRAKRENRDKALRRLEEKNTRLKSQTHPTQPTRLLVPLRHATIGARPAIKPPFMSAPAPVHPSATALQKLVDFHACEASEGGTVYVWNTGSGSKSCITAPCPTGNSWNRSLRETNYSPML
eukprot:PhM_4_TR15627/c0_g1_i1/m.66319